MDFKKAFDKVDRNILLVKLKYGLSNLLVLFKTKVSISGGDGEVFFTIL